MPHPKPAVPPPRPCAYSKRPARPSSPVVAVPGYSGDTRELKRSRRSSTERENGGQNRWQAQSGSITKTATPYKQSRCSGPTPKRLSPRNTRITRKEIWRRRRSFEPAPFSVSPREAQFLTRQIPFVSFVHFVGSNAFRSFEGRSESAGDFCGTFGVIRGRT